MYRLLKSLLFLLPPEQAHYFGMNSLKFILKIPFLNRIFRFENISTVEFCGLTFKNKLGIAAGFDKNANYITELIAIGFGYVEIGTVTQKPQEGNPKPRLFRLQNDEALMNRMGFNNDGCDQVVENLKKHLKRDFIIGGNIGKNKTTPNADAHRDYRICFEKLYPYVDYFVVNVSSPNTPNLRELQDKDMLVEIFDSLQEYRSLQATYKPIFLKIAPDLGQEQLEEILSVYNEKHIGALIVANTTIDYNVLNHDKQFALDQKMGGISGQIMKNKSNDIISYLKSKNSNMKIIGVGGIDDKASADEKSNLGCDLIQVYTGFIYRGTSLIQEILASKPTYA